MLSQYTILGVNPLATYDDIETSYELLKERLDESRFENAPERARNQARACLTAVEKAFNILSDRDRRRAHDMQLNRVRESQSQGGSYSKPRLGQLCVASGMITVDQLEEAVELHVKTGLPLGECLEEKHFISRVELEGLLMGQDLIDVETTLSDSFGLRLIAFKLATEDMILIAQMEMKAQGTSIGEIVARRNWVAAEIIEALS